MGKSITKIKVHKIKRKWSIRGGKFLLDLEDCEGNKYQVIACAPVCKTHQKKRKTE